MAKAVGYSWELRLTWLNKAAEMRSENLNASDYRKKLDEYLTYELSSEVRRRKTCDMLMNIWFYDTDETKVARAEASQLLVKYPEYAPAIHLCLIYMIYPIFADICKYIGRILELQDDVPNAQLMQKLFDEWGERSTVQVACRRVILTLKELGLLKETARLRNVPVMMTITKPDVIAFLLLTVMKIHDGGYYSFSELNNINHLFPFELAITKEQLTTDVHFIVTNFDGELTVALK